MCTVFYLVAMLIGCWLVLGIRCCDQFGASGNTDKPTWGAAQPQNASEMMAKQIADMAASVSPRDRPRNPKRYMAYRNFVKAMPLLTVVRETMNDPAYDVWFVNFSAAVQANYSLSHVPVCEANMTLCNANNDPCVEAVLQPPRCSHLYHDADQLPTSGTAACGPTGRCDTGRVPQGNYLFDFRQANVSVNGVTMADWFIEKYIFSTIDGAGNPLISGFYIDDVWGGGNDANGGPSEVNTNWKADTGFSDADTIAMTAAFRWVADKTYQTLLERGKFVWNQFLNNDFRCPSCGDCPGPWVTQPSCATQLRRYCNVTGPLHTRTMMYGLSGCAAKGLKRNWTTLDGLKQDVASFLLMRGDHAYLTAGWSPCADKIGWDSELFDADYGTPLDQICKETAVNSSVFVREYSKATVQMDCRSWQPTITFKP